MDVFLEELIGGLPDARQIARVVILGLALLSIALTWLILAVVGRIEYGISARRAAQAEEAEERKRRERVSEEQRELEETCRALYFI
jgi:uncharacterized membrane protein